MAKVLKDFRCKVTKRVYRAGDEYDGDRTEELQSLGYVAVDKTGGEEGKPVKKPDGKGEGKGKPVKKPDGKGEGKGKRKDGG